MKLSREWFEDTYNIWIYWQPREQIFGTIKKGQWGVFNWEARIDHRYRVTDQSIVGKAPTLESAKKIVETVLYETKTISYDPWEKYPFRAGRHNEITGGMW
jgi:hypothetical protein